MPILMFNSFFADVLAIMKRIHNSEVHTMKNKETRFLLLHLQFTLFPIAYLTLI